MQVIYSADSVVVQAGNDEYRCKKDGMRWLNESSRICAKRTFHFFEHDTHGISNPHMRTISLSPIVASAQPRAGREDKGNLLVFVLVLSALESRKE